MKMKLSEAMSLKEAPGSTLDHPLFRDLASRGWKLVPGDFNTNTGKGKPAPGGRSILATSPIPGLRLLFYPSGPEAVYGINVLTKRTLGIGGTYSLAFDEKVTSSDTADSVMAVVRQRIQDRYLEPLEERLAKVQSLIDQLDQL